MARYLTKDGILRALTRLSGELGLSEDPHELLITGGAALVLLYGARESTKDVDAVVSNEAVRIAAQSVAAELDLPEDWLKLGAWRDDLDIEDARLLLSKIPGDKETVWEQVQTYVVPGRELKSHYAFEDLWESEHADSSSD